MNSQDFDRIRFVSRHFSELQGLRTEVPIGIALSFVTLGNFVSGMPRFAANGMSIFLASVALGLSVNFWMRRRAGSFYRLHFGAVEKKSVPLSGITSVAICGLLLVLSLVVTWWFRFSAVQIQWVYWGFWFLAQWFRSEARLIQQYKLMLGALLLGLAAFSGLSPFLSLQDTSLLLAVISLAYFLSGLLDHQQLVRAMGGLGPVPREPVSESPELVELR